MSHRCCKVYLIKVYDTVKWVFVPGNSINGYLRSSVNNLKLKSSSGPTMPRKVALTINTNTPPADLPFIHLNKPCSCYMKQSRGTQRLSNRTGMPVRSEFTDPWVKTLSRHDVLEVFSNLKVFSLKTLLTAPRGV